MNTQLLAVMMAVLGSFNVVHAVTDIPTEMPGESIPTLPTPTPTYGWQKALPSTASDKAQANRADLWANKGYRPRGG